MAIDTTGRMPEEIHAELLVLLSITPEDCQLVSDVLNSLTGVDPTRLGAAFICQLAHANIHRRFNPGVVAMEINQLEKGPDAKGNVVKTKSPGQFRGSALAGFSHTHFFDSRHMLQNILIQNKCDSWDELFEKGREERRRLEAEGVPPEEAALQVATQMTRDAWQTRANKVVTGDWLIFKEFEGKKYYLFLSPHTCGTEDQELFDSMKYFCVDQFPFLFEGDA